VTRLWSRAPEERALEHLAAAAAAQVGQGVDGAQADVVDGGPREARSLAAHDQLAARQGRTTAARAGAAALERW
jgi:hypothetical protein